MKKGRKEGLRKEGKKVISKEKGFMVGKKEGKKERRMEE